MTMLTKVCHWIVILMHFPYALRHSRMHEYEDYGPLRVCSHNCYNVIFYELSLSLSLARARAHTHARTPARARAHTHTHTHTERGM